MFFKKWQLLLFVLVLGMSIMAPIPVHAESVSLKQFIPQTALDCGATAENPHRSGGYVIGTATISCGSTHNSLKIRVSINRSGGIYGAYLEKTCSHTWTCSVTGSYPSGGYLPYYSGYTWQTAASGYWENGNQAGDVSPFISL